MCFTEFGIFKANKTVYSLLYICIMNARTKKKIKQTNKQINERISRDITYASTRRLFGRFNIITLTHII